MLDLYKIALENTDEQEDLVLLFKSKYNLENGFYKKPIEFFYWLFKKENDKVTEAKFKKSFIGRMVKFDKKCIPNYTELVFEYEKEVHARKKRITQNKKNKLKRLSSIKNEEQHKG